MFYFRKQKTSLVGVTHHLLRNECRSSLGFASAIRLGSQKRTVSDSTRATWPTMKHQTALPEIVVTCQEGSLDVVSWDHQAHPLCLSPQIEAIHLCRLGKPSQVDT